MRWTTDVALLLAVIEADATVQGVLGSGPMALYKAGERNFEVPSLEWTLVSETPDFEVFQDLLIQFDPFVRTEGDLETLHSSLYRLFHRDREWTTGGVKFRSQFIAARIQPAVDGVYQGPVEFSVKTVRQRYH